MRCGNSMGYKKQMSKGGRGKCAVLIKFRGWGRGVLTPKHPLVTPISMPTARPTATRAMLYYFFFHLSRLLTDDRWSIEQRHSPQDVQNFFFLFAIVLSLKNRVFYAALTAVETHYMFACAAGSSAGGNDETSLSLTVCDDF